MAKPTDLAEWATGAAPIVVPTTPQKQAGWSSGFKPPAQWFNWWMNIVYTWIVWLNGFEATAHTWSAQQTFTGAYQIFNGGAWGEGARLQAANTPVGAGAVSIGTDLAPGINALGSNAGTAIAVQAGANSSATASAFGISVNSVGAGVALSAVGGVLQSPASKAIVARGGGNYAAGVGQTINSSPGGTFTGGQASGDNSFSTVLPGNGIEAFGGAIYDSAHNAAAPGAGVYAKGGTQANVAGLGTGRGGTGVKAVGGDIPAGGGQLGYSVEATGDMVLTGDLSVIGAAAIAGNLTVSGFNQLISSYIARLNQAWVADLRLNGAAVNATTALLNRLTPGLVPKAWATIQITAGVPSLLDGQNVGNPTIVGAGLDTIAVPLAGTVQQVHRAVFTNLHGYTAHPFLLLDQSIADNEVRTQFLQWTSFSATASIPISGVGAARLYVLVFGQQL